ncbi:MAG: GatB/YqeY domain-containing protein [Sarcina sp.]
MPTIKERLQGDWKDAMKAKDRFRSGVLSMTKSAVLQIEKNEGIELEDARVIEILAREIKQRREAMLDFEKGNRQDLVDQSQAEIEILLNYLPQQLSEEELKSIIKEAAIEVGASNIKDMGKLMANVRPKTVGKADGKVVSQFVKEYLSK